MIFYSETKKLRVYRKGNSIQFVDGKYEADEAEAEILRRVPECWESGVATEDLPVGKYNLDLEQLTSTELRQYAKENGIELPKGLRGADEVLAAIKDFEK